jgi:short subunit dehydrogenase-like uncharacterized protein
MPASHVSPYDIVLFSANSFAGQQAVSYFSKSAAVKQSGLRWALCGRSAAELECVRHGIAIG